MTPEPAISTLGALLTAHPVLLVGAILVVLIGGVIGVYVVRWVISLIKVVFGFAIGAAAISFILWLAVSGIGLETIQQWIPLMS